MNGREMASTARITERQLYRWVKRGWLKPQRVTAPQWLGMEFYFCPEEQRVGQLMGALVRAGLYPDAAHKLARGNVARLDLLMAALAKVRAGLAHGGPAGPVDGGGQASR